MKKALLIIALAMGTVWVYSPKSQEIPQKAGQGIIPGGKAGNTEQKSAQLDTFPGIVHPFQECKQVAEQFLKDRSQKISSGRGNLSVADRQAYADLYSKGEITKWAVYLGEDDRPYEYEFLYEVFKRPLVSIFVETYTLHVSTHNLDYLTDDPQEKYSNWEKGWKRPSIPVAEFDYVPLVQKAIESQYKIKLEKDPILYEFYQRPPMVLFKVANSDKKTAAFLIPQRHPFLVPGDFETIRKEQYEQ